MIEISEEELALFLMSLVRYSLGRRSYIVTDAILAIEKYIHKIPKWDQDRIIEQIQENIDFAVRGNRFVGDEMDHRAWEESLKRLREFQRVRKILEE